MDLEKLEKMAKIIAEDLKGTHSLSFGDYRTKKAEFRNFIVLASKALPDHDAFFKTVSEELANFDFTDAKQAVRHILAIIEFEKASESKTKEMKIFESADEKMKQSAFSFRKEDYPSTFHNLNTALELVLKDKLAIPITITKINTSRIIDILTKHKVELSLFLSEVKKRVVLIDNKIKHQAYSPSKIDCISGIKAMEELISKLRDKEIRLSEEVKNKIYEGL